MMKTLVESRESRFPGRAIANRRVMLKLLFGAAGGLLLIGGAGQVASPAHAAEMAKAATMYKNPQCGCCGEYAKYLRLYGYKVKVVETHDLVGIKKRYNVPEKLEGCHTLVIGNYAVEGMVPVKHVERLLKEKPAIKGISLPGMPEGSPGMGGPKRGPFTIYEIAPGKPKTYAVD